MSANNEQDDHQVHRIKRPRLGNRAPSGSMVIPRDHPEIEIGREEYPADDARAMSPRRNIEELERLSKEARHTLKE